ncbi:MAG: GDP-mannose 4,6-dehydratase [Elusimicrobia bacterium]|nr:GDP-mannose 4,6-dehydratase [Elusimicrobiota bacterium]
MEWKKKRVLITGSGGFIASHLLERLVGLHASVNAFVRYNSRNDCGLIEHLPPVVKKSINIIAGDLRDYDAVYDAMKGCDTVFHLAALIAIPYSYVHPREVIETNIMGTYNVLNAARRLKVKKVVHTSTSEVYGTAVKVPISEDHPLQGQSPYSASKIGADKIAESFYCSFGLPVATIRPFNTYGPGQSARAIVPTIITQALKNNVVYLGSLTPKRDLTYVTDTVEGFIKVSESEKVIGEVINIGSGSEIAIGDLAKKVVGLLDKNIKIVLEKKRIRPKNSEVERLLADNKKAKKLLGWTPKVSLEQGLEETIKWFRDNLKSYKTDIYNV